MKSQQLNRLKIELESAIWSNNVKAMIFISNLIKKMEAR